MSVYFSIRYFLISIRKISCLSQMVDSREKAENKGREAGKSIQKQPGDVALHGHCLQPFGHQITLKLCYFLSLVAACVSTTFTTGLLRSWAFLSKEKGALLKNFKFIKMRHKHRNSCVLLA